MSMKSMIDLWRWKGAEISDRVVGCRCGRGIDTHTHKRLARLVASGIIHYTYHCSGSLSLPVYQDS